MIDCELLLFSSMYVSKMFERYYGRSQSKPDDGRSSLAHNVAMLAHTHDVDVGSQLCSLQFVSSPFELPRGTQGHSRRERKHHQQLPKLSLIHI